jgi:hypothetical protein
MKKIVNLEVVTTRGWKKIVNLEVVTIRGWKKIVNLEVVTTRGWKKKVNLEVVTTGGWKKIVNLEVVTTRGWKKIVNLEFVTTRGWKKIVNLEVVTTRIWKKIVKVVNFVVVEGPEGFDVCMGAWLSCCRGQDLLWRGSIPNGHWLGVIIKDLNFVGSWFLPINKLQDHHSYEIHSWTISPIKSKCKIRQLSNLRKKKKLKW